MGLLFTEYFLDKSNLRAGGKPHVGRYVCCTPGNQYMTLNVTSGMGGATGLFYGAIFQMGKWEYRIKKIDESMEVSPMHAEAYQLTIGQKRQLEATIKEGLGGAAQAVTDYELLLHDLRKYKEILIFLRKGKKDDHVLRSLFVDRVDVHNAGFSMIDMVGTRWPTLIADFLRMATVLKPEETKDKEKIRKALGISDAEATVLKIKNELYDEWKKRFEPEVRERYARVKVLVEARKRSVEEYREWLKPYVARYKMMKEITQSNPGAFISSFFISPAFGIPTSMSTMLFYAYKPFKPPEIGKPFRAYEKKLDPLDGVVKDFAEELKKKTEPGEMYEGVKIFVTKEELKEYEEEMKKKGVKADNYVCVEEVRDNAYKAAQPTQDLMQMVKGEMYYRMLTVNVSKSIVKVPKGGELEDIIFDINHWILSQNVILCLLVELAVKGIAFNRSIQRLIGLKEAETEAFTMIDKDIDDAEGKEEKKESKIKPTQWFKKGLKGFKREVVFKYILKSGPYETDFQDRLTKQFMIPMGGMFWQFANFIKWKAGVPGVPEGY